MRSHQKKLPARILKVLEKRKQAYIALLGQIQTDLDVDIVHDFRVASRRLLAVEPLLRSAGKTRAWRKGVRHALKTLNRLRDIQVMQERFASIASLNAELAKDLQREQGCWLTVSKDLVQEELDSKIGKSLEQIRYLAESKPKRLYKETCLQWKRIHKAINKALRKTRADRLETLHRLRVRYKSVRYFVELLVDTGILARQQKSGLKYWQDLLGNIHDCDVARAWLEKKGPETADLRASLTGEIDTLSRQFFSEKQHFQQLIDELDGVLRHRLGTML
jgi:CHAD domain-containing protein